MVLTCSTIDEGAGSISWLYNGMTFSSSEARGFTPADPINISIDAMVSGFMFMFSVELISKNPQAFASTLSFRADAAMNGHSVLCRVAILLSIIETMQMLQIAQTGKLL